MNIYSHVADIEQNLESKLFGNDTDFTEPHEHPTSFNGDTVGYTTHTYNASMFEATGARLNIGGCDVFVNLKAPVTAAKAVERFGEEEVDTYEANLVKAIVGALGFTPDHVVGEEFACQQARS